jgi:hypothetical protein
MREPTLIMEGDIVDISSYNEADTQNRIDAFIEALAAYKKGHRKLEQSIYLN